MADTRLMITGAGGRMGRTLIRIAAGSPGVRVTAALARPGSPILGEDAGTLAGLPPLGLAVSDDIDAALADADVVIDFSAPGATIYLLAHTAQHRVAHIIGTTGLTPADEVAISAAAKLIAVVKSGNMSLGVNLLAGLVRRASAALGPEFDIEIAEMHHRHKVDAPSGTALMLAHAAAAARRVALDDVAVRGRDGLTGPRPSGAIGVAALRGGSVVGDHSVIFAGEGERIELVHRADDRTIFARGAIAAALWARGRTPGLYSMADVLGLAD